ncbi:hypothetical protein [Telmatospirillum sp. J64-1]|uniref:hypothetical protein n=1 Tax=Telmatospirillum sp. J64-1 TaxID=2502183 RepID=UPI00115D7136|nr:hypothetical protein [Telmatospirillum sp. J64-1]
MTSDNFFGTPSAGRLSSRRANRRGATAQNGRRRPRRNIPGPAVMTSARPSKTLRQPWFTWLMEGLHGDIPSPAGHH